MSASSPVPKDHPLMVAWEAYKQTDDYKNTKVWAQHPAHVDGSLWAVFERGWLAAGGRRPFDDRPVCENCQQPIDGAPVITADEVYLHDECARGIWTALTVVPPPAASGPPSDGSVFVRVDSVYVEQMRGDGMAGPFSRVRLVEGEGEPRLELTTQPAPTPNTAEWWREVAQGLGVEIHKLQQQLASGPPAAHPADESAWLVETHILSHLHYLRSWNARLSKPEWTSRNDEAWRFARREDADKALVYLACGDGRVAEHLWVPMRRAAPVAPPPAVAPPETSCGLAGHAWPNQFGDDWYPADGTRCACGYLEWCGGRNGTGRPALPLAVSPRATGNGRGVVPPSSTWGDLGPAARCSRCGDDGRPCFHCATGDGERDVD